MFKLASHHSKKISLSLIIVSLLSWKFLPNLNRSGQTLHQVTKTSGNIGYDNRNTLNQVLTRSGNTIGNTSGNSTHTLNHVLTSSGNTSGNSRHTLNQVLTSSGNTNGSSRQTLNQVLTSSGDKGYDSRPHMVMGILSVPQNYNFREASRNTWIKNMIKMNNDLPFRITYKFLLDEATKKTSEENNIHQDILFLNITDRGRAFKFGKKLYTWIKYIHQHFPDVLLGAKLDDDAYLCVPQIFERLNYVKSNHLYYGLKHGTGKKVSISVRIDEYFVVLGKTLITRISNKSYCPSTNCSDGMLIDTNNGGTSLGAWLAGYTDIDFQSDNGRMIQHFPWLNKKSIKSNLCEKKVVVHKISVDGMRKLQNYNENRTFASKVSSIGSVIGISLTGKVVNNTLASKVSNFGSVTGIDFTGKVVNNTFASKVSNIGSVTGINFTRKVVNNTFASKVSSIGSVTGISFSGKVVRTLPSTLKQNNMAVAYNDNFTHCDNWAVVTTIFPPTKAIRFISKLSDWCLVIVADVITPSQNNFVTNNTKGNKEKIKYLSVKEQQMLYPMLSSVIPFRHFGRKNIGYIYAIQHKAKAIWDFDDDNGGIVDLSDFKSAKYSTNCRKMDTNLFNPYPYFVKPHIRVWPRGFPLQNIKNKKTFPEICEIEKTIKIGVIQSLANGQADVDAIYRFTYDFPFHFTAERNIVLPKNKYAPFNAQATMWFPPAFMYMALPLSVNGRVSDIWRSYIADFFFHKTGLSVVFAKPYVNHQRTAHSIIADFNGESSLYEKSLQLVDLLSNSSFNNMKEAYESLYQRNYIDDKDLSFIIAWTKTFLYITQKNKE
ncbi:uncharacterized protein LOC134685241 [Mytilus trossulus]|uniref:uncharacterized protein LOC134685241 n=1 Tax=Mytilus trossulus TaxID=6551 RepID=UPI0030065EB9